jgi:SNF2 family DNA or RNA helicase
MREDVISDLPKKTWKEIPVDLDYETRAICDRLYEEFKSSGIDIEKAIKEAIESKSKKISIESWSKIRQALATAKIPSMISIIEDYEDQEEPLVVFSAHRSPIDFLNGRKGWAVITGDTPSDERSKIEKDFQSGKYKCLAGTIQAAGVAITLTRAAHALFVDLSPTPGLNAQAEDRLCRIGQNRGVLISTFVANHPIEKNIYKILRTKNEMIGFSVEMAKS